jgi:hypothetical protein
MKASVLLSLVVLGAALALALSGGNGGRSDGAALPLPAQPEEVLPGNQPGLFPLENIRYLGHDWIESLDSLPQKASPLAPSPQKSSGHPAHPAAANCRVCELIRVMTAAW